MSFLKSLFRITKNAKKLVGKDKLGNKYYEVISGSGEDKPRRSVESLHEHADYQAGEIPLEWEAWVRGKRSSPPTPEEIVERENVSRVILRRAEEVDRKEKVRQRMEYDEGLVAEPPPETQTIGHASGPTRGTMGGVEEPSVSGNKFEPASWEPPTKPK